jgi:SAM-dependent methyltransferase
LLLASSLLASIVSSGFPQQFWKAFRDWWREQARDRGTVGAASLLLRNLWGFARDSTPERRRQRFGDMDYDWENRVNTTSGTVSWQARLLGLVHSPYQPTEPTLFHEMMASLPIEFEQFTFVDIGSGKGRTLLMASKYPYKKIVGVELIAELHRAAVENIGAYKNATQRCSHVEAICMDACDFPLPAEPLVLYLFNPLPERGLKHVVASLEKSLKANPRPVYVIYHNPLLDHLLRESGVFGRVGGTEQYSIYSAEKAV